MQYIPGEVIRLNQDVCGRHEHRPFVVVSDTMNGYLVAPLTTQDTQEHLWVPVTGNKETLGRSRYARVDVPRVIWDRSVSYLIGEVDEETLRNIQRGVQKELAPLMCKEISR